jgi:hypothetical protein
MSLWDQYNISVHAPLGIVHVAEKVPDYEPDIDSLHDLAVAMCLLVERHVVRSM